jgi:transcriptional regulator with XRE-family HTH domain
MVAAAERSRDILRQIGRELRDARLDHNLALYDVCRSIGLSVAHASRIERGLVAGVPVVTLARMAAMTGLDLSMKLYPAGPPLRDAAHAALLSRLRRRLHPSLQFRTEIPLPIHGDKRAWDAAVDGRDWWIPIEAETKPRDMQALDRRIALKRRDADIDAVILLLVDSRHNRALAGHLEAGFAARYPVPGRRALELLEAGLSPGGSAIILL